MYRLRFLLPNICFFLSLIFSCFFIFLFVITSTLSRSELQTILFQCQKNIRGFISAISLIVQLLHARKAVILFVFSISILFFCSTISYLIWNASGVLLSLFLSPIYSFIILFSICCASAIILLSMLLIGHSTDLL